MDHEGEPVLICGKEVVPDVEVLFLLEIGEGGAEHD